MVFKDIFTVNTSHDQRIDKKHKKEEKNTREVKHKELVKDLKVKKKIRDVNYKKLRDRRYRERYKH